MSAKTLPAPSAADILGGDAPNLASDVWNAAITFTLLQYGQGVRTFAEVAANGRKFWRPGFWALPRRAALTPALAGKKRSVEAWACACAAMRGNSFPEALEGLDRAVRAEPRSADLHILRGLIRLGGIIPLVYSDFEKFLEASAGPQEDLERALRLAPGAVWAHVVFGILEYLRRRFQSAFLHFDRAVGLEPDWDWARILKADAIYYLRRVEEALAEFDKAVKLNPRNAWAFALLGRAKNLTRDASMGGDLDRAIALESEAGWIYAWRGIAKAAVTNDPTALADYDRAKSLDRGYDRIFAWRGSQLIKLKRYSEALPDLAHAIKLNPHIDITHYSLGRVYFRLGRIRDGVSEIRKAVDASHRSIWINNWGDWNHQNHARRETLVDLDSVVEHRPRAAWARAWRGQTFLSLKEYDRALADLNGAIALDPLPAYPYAWRGETLRSMGRPLDAARDFDKALERDPACVWAHAWRGFVRLEAGECRGAVSDLSRALRLNRRTALAYVWRLQAHLRLGRIERALEDAESALEFYPSWKWLRLMQARLRDRLGRPPEAVLQALDQVIGLAPRPEILMLRAYYLGRDGRSEEARRELARAGAQGAPAPLLRAIERSILRARRAGRENASDAWVARRLRRDGPWDLAEDFAALDDGRGDRFWVCYDDLAAKGPPRLAGAIRRLQSGEALAAVMPEFDAVLRERPGHYGASVVKADCLLKFEPPLAKEAEALAGRCLELDPGGREALLIRFQARKSAGNWAGALKDLEAVRQAQDMRVTIEAGKLLLLLNRPEAAYRKAQEVLDLEPFSPQAGRLAAEAKLAQGDFRAVRRLMESLLDVMPRLSWPHLMLSRAAFLENGAEAALAHVAAAIDGPARLSAETYGWKAVYLASLDRRTAMQGCLDSALRLDSSRFWHESIQRSLEGQAAPRARAAAESAA